MAYPQQNGELASGTLTLVTVQNQESGHIFTYLSYFRAGLQILNSQKLKSFLEFLLLSSMYIVLKKFQTEVDIVIFSTCHSNKKFS
jgi:hypothetical protein